MTVFLSNLHAFPPPHFPVDSASQTQIVVHKMPDSGSEFIPIKRIINREIRCLKKLGAGGYGEVFLAQPILKAQKRSFAFPDQFVVKVLTVAARSVEDLEAVYREFSALDNLRHPHIVEYIGFWKEAGTGMFADRFCVAMKYCNGGDLRQFYKKCLKAASAPTSEVIVRLMVCVFSALNHSHHMHVIHRDIKPANILLANAQDGTIAYAQVGDFGLSRPVDQTMQLVTTRVGTPNYCSPEIVQEREYTNKTDIFSAGVMFYELMALEAPFWQEKKSVTETMERIVHHDPIPRFRQRCKERYSEGLMQTIAACLNKAETLRPSAYEVLSVFSLSVWQTLRATGITVYPDSFGKEGYPVFKKHITTTDHASSEETPTDLPNPQVAEAATGVTQPLKVAPAHFLVRVHGRLSEMIPSNTAAVRFVMESIHLAMEAEVATAVAAVRLALTILRPSLTPQHVQQICDLVADPKVM